MTGFNAAMSHYEGGFKGGLTVRGMPLAVTHPGKVFWVSDTGVAAFPNRKTPSDGNDGSFNAPFATIEYAMSQTVANRGDVIFVLPGHTETITTDGGLALDVAGVAVIGLGTGTLRPLLLLDTAAAAAVTVTAANITLQNFELRASFADITNAIDVTAAWFAIDNCEFTEEGANLNFVDYIVASSTTDNNADGISVTNCVGTTVDAVHNGFLRTVADVDRLVYCHNYFNCDTTSGQGSIVCAGGKDLTDCKIMHNVHLNVATTGDVFIENNTTDNTGVVAYNLVGHADTASAVIIDCDGVRQFENYSASEDTSSGLLLPAADDDT